MVTYAGEMSLVVGTVLVPVHAEPVEEPRRHRGDFDVRGGHQDSPADAAAG